MVATVSGVVHGKVIELDEAVPDLEGRRVRVVVEPVVDESSTDPIELRHAWDAWASHGPQGPIEDEGEPEFP